MSLKWLIGTLHKSWARICLYCNFLFASRKQRRPSTCQDFYWVRAARIQAGFPHVWEEPGTFVDDSDGSKLMKRTVTFFGSASRQFVKRWLLSFFCFVCFSAGWHVCRFRHHDRQVAGWDHSAYPAVQSHHWQDKVRRSTLILCNTRITDGSPSEWSWLIIWGSQNSLDSIFFGQ